MSIRVWWKRKYGYSSTDPRYLNATESDMIHDMFEDIVDRFIKDPERNRKEFETSILNVPNADELMAQDFKNELENMKREGFDMQKLLKDFPFDE